MREKGRTDLRPFAGEPDSTVRVRPLGVDERTLAIARSVAPEMDRLLAAYEARVAKCDHLAFDDLTGAITYRDGDRVLFRGVVEELARLDANDVLRFAWRDLPGAPPPTPRVDTARSMLKGLGLDALGHGALTLDGTQPADVDALIRLALHLFEADGLFREERGGAMVFYAVYEGTMPARPGRSGRLGATLASFRPPRTTTRPIPREETEGEVLRVESVAPAAPRPSQPAFAAVDPRPRTPAHAEILPIAQMVFTELASVLSRVSSAVLLANVSHGPPRVVHADVLATDGSGELHAFEASPNLRRAVEDLLEREANAGNGPIGRLVVHMSADTSIRTQVR